MLPVPADPLDEGSHEPGVEPFWNESWYFDFATRDGSLGGYVRVGLYPNLGAVWYWACLVGEGRPLVMVVDHEIALPRSGSLEVRTSGLWADHNCETPLEHWSLGLEAFAVALDNPTEAYGAMWGDRVPFGFDLEWETDGEAFRPPGVDRYEIPCRVHGEVLVGADTIELDAVGQREHSWGVRDWWAHGWCWTAFQLDDASAWNALVTAEEPEGVALASVDLVPGPDGIPKAASLSIASTGFTVDPVAWAPILLTAPDGRQSRLPRALARFRSGDGRGGVGWIEFNQPQALR